MSGPRVALVHDWLASYGGSEQVLLELHRAFPDAPVFTAVHNPGRLPAAFDDLDVRTSFLQRLPLARTRYQAYLPLMPTAFEQFDMRGFDIVLSDCHACCKGVIVPQSTPHICYCYTPIRYAWSHQEQYLNAVPAGLRSPARRVLSRVRRWDFVAAQGVDVFIADCDNVRRRISKYYRREASVIRPPVHIERFHPAPEPPSESAPFVVVGRLVPYKRVDSAVVACTRLGLPLRVIGRGPELERLRRLAGPTVTFTGELPDADLEREYRECRALIFTAEEDFGLVPLEAMASGRPVLALGLGGACETVLPGVTGELYGDGGAGGLAEALANFAPERYAPAACRARAEEFAPERFRDAIRAAVERELGSRQGLR